METGMILGLVMIMTSMIAAAAVLRWAPEEWLHAYVVMARSLGRLI